MSANETQMAGASTPRTYTRDVVGLYVTQPQAILARRKPDELSHYPAPNTSSV